MAHLKVGRKETQKMETINGPILRDGSLSGQPRAQRKHLKNVTLPKQNKKNIPGIHTPWGARFPAKARIKANET